MISGTPTEEGLVFRPEEDLSRAEAAVMLQKLLRLPGVPLSLRRMRLPPFLPGRRVRSARSQTQASRLLPRTMRRR